MFGLSSVISSNVPNILGGTRLGGTLRDRTRPVLSIRSGLARARVVRLNALGLRRFDLAQAPFSSSTISASTTSSSLTDDAPAAPLSDDAAFAAAPCS